MLFYIWLLQIVVYLFVSPSLIAVIDPDSPHNLSAFLVAGLFLAMFLVGHGGLRRSPAPVLGVQAMHSFTSLGRIFLLVWCGAHIYLCIKYGLYDRRVGTDVAAIMFAEIPVLELLVIRSLEIFLPYLLAITLYGLTRDRSPLRFLVPIGIIGSLALSGVGNSRSMVVVLGLSTIVVLQNLISRRTRRLLLVGVGALGLTLASVITVYRMASEGESDVRFYAESQFLKRLDGLEVVSTLVAQDRVQTVGQHPEIILLPLIAAIPLSARATEVKELALTTVKANILDQEFDSEQRDINSFAITDVYYVGGIIGVVLVGLLLGRTSRWVDEKIGAVRSRSVHLLLVACVCNGFMLERETIGILITILRDWFLLMGLMALICRWKPINVLYANVLPRRSDERALPAAPAAQPAVQ